MSLSEILKDGRYIICNNGVSYILKNTSYQNSKKVTSLLLNNLGIVVSEVTYCVDENNRIINLNGNDNFDIIKVYDEKIFLLLEKSALYNFNLNCEEYLVYADKVFLDHI